MKPATASAALERPVAPACGLPPATHLGTVPVDRFLREHWQRRPLLVRRALPGLLDAAPPAMPPIAVRELFALARDPDVESRLVDTPSVPGGAWRLRQGPFGRLPPRTRPNWTLLVQGVDLHLAAGRALMDRFRFIPDARLDDLMVSFATDGGGVGAHVDSYDVFLLQIHGRRRWRVAPPGPWRFLPDAPLKLLARFEPEATWLLEPGDMLYLPPGWAHEGTAVGECMTCSVGFRSPAAAELRRAFFAFLADDAPPPADAAMSRRYRDRARTPVRRPAAIPADMAASMRRWLQGWQPPAELVDRFIGCHLTEPKPTVWFDGAPDTALPSDGGAGIALAAKSRMLYRAGCVYINGEALALPRAGRTAALRLLQALADQRGLDAVQTGRAIRHPWLRDTLQAWLAAGWITLRRPRRGSGSDERKHRDAGS